VKKAIYLFLVLSLGLASCQKEKTIGPGLIGPSSEKSMGRATNDPQQYETTAYANWPETFESGTKTAYSNAAITLITGRWSLNDALIGTSTSDPKFRVIGHGF
jgi:endonuclease G